jgi:putative ABC transport system permease protein
VIANAVVLQIVIVTTFGVLVGGFVTLLLSLGLPDGIPIVFSAKSLLLDILLLILIGPIGGLVAVRSAIKVEPLTALGLSA